VIAAHRVVLFVRNIGWLQRAIVARVLIVVKDHFTIKVFHTFLQARGMR
jgi:hypothetical protein